MHGAAGQEVRAPLKSGDNRVGHLARGQFAAQITRARAIIQRLADRCEERVGNLLPAERPAQRHFK